MTPMNLSMKQKQSHRHREQTCGYHAGTGKGWIGGLGISRCKLVDIGWINNKVLLYSTGYDIQYSVINHNEKECGKDVYVCIYMCVYIYIYLNHFAIQQKLTQHCKSTILQQYKFEKRKSCLVFRKHVIFS